MTVLPLVAVAEANKWGCATLTNSGTKGVDFPLGGSISVDSTTPGGEYLGTFEVTAEYQ